MSDLPKTPSLNEQLFNAVSAVAKAQDFFNRTTAAVEKALKDQDEAREKLSAEQEQFDKIVDFVRKDPPARTRWAEAVFASKIR